MTTTPEGLVDLVVDRLINRTDAADQVFGYRDWPTAPRQFPLILIDLPDEEKQSQGRGSVGFTAMATLTLHGQVKASAKVDDKGANEVRMALARLRRQIDLALINDPAVMAVVQQIAFVRSKSAISAEGEAHLGEVAVQLGLEYYQDASDFAPICASDLLVGDVVADLISPVDASGTYPAPSFYSATPAPRTAGPDGRVEGRIHLDLSGAE